MPEMITSGKRRILCRISLLTYLCSVAYFAFIPWSSFAEDYAEYEPIGVGLFNFDIEIENPEPLESWLAGSPHSVWIAVAADDKDCRLSDGASVTDDVTHYWTGSGTFDNNTSIGMQVTYVCRNTAGQDSLTAHADDNYDENTQDPYYNEANYDEALAEDEESSAEVTVYVRVPQVSSIDYTGGHTITDVTGPEFTTAGPTNLPTAYNIGQLDDVAAEVKFQATSNLDEESDVEVYGIPVSLDVRYWEPTSGTFEDFPTTEPFVCAGAVIKDEVGKVTYTENWFYKCPDGSDTWISAASISSRVMYLTRTTPVLNEPIACYEKSTAWAAGKDGSDSDQAVCTQIMTGFTGHYLYDGGNCEKLSSNFKHLVAVQGVTLTLRRWGITNGTADLIKSKSIAVCGNATPATYEWVFHQWAELANFGTIDPSTATLDGGSWQSHEDAIIGDYRVNTVWQLNNPSGQTTETGWGVTPGNPTLLDFSE